MSFVAELKRRNALRAGACLLVLLKKSDGDGTVAKP